MSLAAVCSTEIGELHHFLEAWLCGRTSRDRAIFERFENALAESFLIIHPSGNSDDKASIVEQVYGAHGKKAQDFTIEVRNVRTRFIQPPWCLLTYEEWQRDTGRASARLSSVLLRETGNGIEWMHVHETRLIPDT